MPNGDLSSLTRFEPGPCSGNAESNHWIAREFPIDFNFIIESFMTISNR